MRVPADLAYRPLHPRLDQGVEEALEHAARLRSWSRDERGTIGRGGTIDVGQGCLSFECKAADTSWSSSGLLVPIYVRSRRRRRRPRRMTPLRRPHEILVFTNAPFATFSHPRRSRFAALFRA